MTPSKHASPACQRAGTEKRLILFVDDEPNILSGLKRAMRSMRKTWDMHFADSGAGALELMDEMQPDVVVADMRMPGMDGAMLLSEVQERAPAALRIILTGHSEYTSVMDAIRHTHQFLSKPCSVEQLCDAINRASVVQGLLENPAMREMISRIETLPSQPSLYQEIELELHAADPSIARVGRLVEQDVGMAASILKLVNSSFFGLQSRVDNVQQAVTLLGIDTVKTLVLAVHLFQTDTAVELPGFSMADLWRHSHACAQCARAISASEKLPRDVQADSFIAGLMHDLGKLVLAAHNTDQYIGVLENAAATGRRLWDVEREYLQVTHAEVGAYLLGLWGFSLEIVEAVARHHDTGAPPPAADKRPLRALSVVHAANAISEELDPTRPREQVQPLDMEFLSARGVAPRLPVWREVCARALGVELPATAQPDPNNASEQ